MEERSTNNNAPDYLEYFFDWARFRPWNTVWTVPRCNSYKPSSCPRNLRRPRSPECRRWSIYKTKQVKKKSNLNKCTGRPELDTFLFDFHGFLFDDRRSLYFFGGIRHDSVFVEVFEEEAVDESRFSQARLSDDHQSKIEALLHRLPVHLVRQCGESNVIPVRFVAWKQFVVDEKAFFIIREQSPDIFHFNRRPKRPLAECRASARRIDRGFPF